MVRDTPLVRQWLLIKMLAARRYGLTVREMAEELGVNERTIRRDLQTFLAVGFPIEETVGERGRKLWRLRGPAGRADLSFALDEVLALYIARRFLDPLAGTVIWEAAQNAFQKIRACVGKSALAYLEKMAGNLHHTSIGAGDYAAKSQLLDDLIRAIEDRKATVVLYQSQRATEPVEYELYPYGLVFHRGSLYLVAFSRDHDELRHFKVDRISEVEVSNFPFRMPDDFNLAKHLANSFGVFHGKGDVAVKVRFSPDVARYVEESKWHASQQLSKQKDGSLLAEFRLSSTEEIKRWILSFGQNAVVVEPEALRADIQRELTAMRRQYSSARI